MTTPNPNLSATHAALIERLEAQAAYDKKHYPPANPLFTEAAQAIRDLEAALKPLAECEIVECDPPLLDSDIARYPFTMGEVRAARFALQSYGDTET